ncbi:hypothetical protein BLX87_06450 [Bacillus sp. VT-16-64]|nr:hypothetical protein BLX87_06450 [Bacillus sp. VT-16-64]
MLYYDEIIPHTIRISIANLPAAGLPIRQGEKYSLYGMNGRNDSKLTSSPLKHSLIPSYNIVGGSTYWIFSRRPKEILE